MSKEKKELIQLILVTLERLIKTTSEDSPNQQNAQIAKSISKNRAKVFDQLRFYEQYANPSVSNNSDMQTTYLKWKAIYDSYNFPQKVIRHMHEGILTKKQQHAILYHFLGEHYYKEVEQRNFQTVLPHLIQQKFLNTK